MSGWRSLDGGTTIDRSQTVPFTWAGRRYTGFIGDTLASALLANGVSVFGRSFKYHRPRGLLGAGLEEPNAIIQLERGAAAVPNVKATQIELYADLIAAPVNAWPSLKYDVLAVNRLVKRFIPAAFYYKTFMWPGWQLFEPLIRKAAGLGKAPQGADPDIYEHRFYHVDTLVIGSGAAGLAAAESAAKAAPAKMVLLVEADPIFGGGLLSEPRQIEGMTASDWREATLGRLKAVPNVRLMARTMAFGFYDHGMIALCESLTDHLPLQARSGPRERLWKVRCRRAIFATGAFERPLAFANNDLPGVMLASAAQTYALRYGAVAGRRVVVATNNDSGYQAAFAVQQAGAKVVAIIDSRDDGAAKLQVAGSSAPPVLCNNVPLIAKGRLRVSGLGVGTPDGQSRQTLACDTVLMAGGWNPAVHLHSQSGGVLAYSEPLQSLVPAGCVQNTVSVGAAAGEFDVAAAITGARAAGRGSYPMTVDPAAIGPTRKFVDGESSASKVWVDFQNDVTLADIHLAARENFRSIEHLKRYTTLGMASDQGKTSNVVGIQALSDLLEKPAQEIGTTRFRPPYDPVTIGCFAGRSVGADLMPLRQVSAHAEQLSMGAEMEPYGQWLRAAFYRRPGEAEELAVAREVGAVRNSVGLFDGSPLGKIEVKGPDAAEFLQRMYVNDVRSLKVGRCRYGLMLSEHGIVKDDGIVARLANNHFLVGTTSGNAHSIAESFQEWLQCEWPHLDALVEDVTTGWAVMNVAGPKARDTLEAIGTDVDLSLTTFPHMACRTGTVAGVPARIQRVSFSGELSYEMAVPWAHGPALWNACLSAGSRFGITPFGVEALMTMRIEKGFLHVGSDTDGTTYPQDIGFGNAMERKADDFVGRRSAMRPDARRKDRRALVGIEVADGGGILPVGGHVLPEAATKTGPSEGWVTSSVMSPTFARPLALALVRRGSDRLGETVKIWHLGRWRTGTIATPRFYDPTGDRLNG